jgi:tape measure domain-containing protein
MEEIGVMAVVKNLAKFQEGMGSIDKAIGGIVPTSGLLGSALSGLGDIAQSVGGWIADTLANAIGKLLADAVEWATQKLWEMVEGSLAIADQFQALEIRLKQLNFNDATASGMEYADAMKLATDQTKEQLDWIQKLAFATPFEMEDITNVYGLARAFGYTDQGARDLTKELGDFVFGMGLTGDAANSIVKQFGQMNSTGKIMQKNLNALAQGGMVPVTKLLDIMKEKTGLSEKAFKDFLLTSEGVTMFKQTFSEYVENQFAGAGERANRTYKNATITLKEFFQTLLAGNVVTPIIAQIGEGIAKLNDALQSRLPQIQDAFGRIGAVIADIVKQLTGNTDVNAFADGFVNALNRVASWLEGHKDDIIGWFKTAADEVDKLRKFIFGYTPTETTTTTQARPDGGTMLVTSTRELARVPGLIDKIKESIQKVSDWIDTYIVPAFEKISSWYEKNGDVIDLFFQSIGDIISDVFNIDIGDADPIQGILDGLTKFMNFVTENKDAIALFIKVWAAFAIIGGIVSQVLGVIVGIVTTLAGVWLLFVGVAQIVVPIVEALGVVLGILPAVLAAPIIPIALLVAAFAWVAGMIYYHGEEMWNTIKQMVFLIGYYLGLGFGKITEWAASVGTTFENWVNNSKAKISTWGADTWNSIKTWGLNVWTSISTTWSQLLSIIGYYAGQIWSLIKQWGSNVWNSIASINWYGLGTSMVQGMINGLWGMLGSLVNAAANIAINAYNAARRALMSHSPSKLFESLGEDTIQGFIDGIDGAAGAAAKAMQGVVGGVVSVAAMTPAMVSSSSPSSVSNTTNNNNYNLNINSSARVEPIISDFNLLASLQSR